jgi:hypothetical protein
MNGGAVRVVSLQIANMDASMNGQASTVSLDRAMGDFFL